MRDREKWARSIDNLVELAGHPPTISSVVIRSRMVLPCVAPLRAIAGVLRDPARPVSPMAMRELRAFVCDGATSPLHGSDPEAAGVAARDVASLFRIDLRATHHDRLAA
jgi:hypothetical protein